MEIRPATVAVSLLCGVAAAVVVLAVLAACVPQTPGQPTEQVWIARYCNATTPALRAAIRWQMGLAPDQEMVCPAE